MAGSQYQNTQMPLFGNLSGGATVSWTVPNGCTAQVVSAGGLARQLGPGPANYSYYLSINGMLVAHQAATTATSVDDTPLFFQSPFSPFPAGTVFEYTSSTIGFTATLWLIVNVAGVL